MAIWAIIWLLWAGSALTSPDVTISTPTRIAFAPITITFRIDLAPHPDNRLLCLEYDGGEYSRSCWDLDSESPKTRWVRRTIGQAGEYVVVATVYRVQPNGRQSEITARTTLSLLDPG